MGVYRVYGDCTPYTTTYSIVVRPHTSPVCVHTAPRHRASVPSLPPSLSGPSAPTITQYPSAAPDRPHATLQVNVNTYTALQLPRLAHRRPARQAYHVRAIYAALDVSGVRGDAYEDGKEPTRARLGSDRSLIRLPPSPGPALPGEGLTTAEKEMLNHADE